MRYGVLLIVTSAARTQAVEPLGRCATRTSTHPGRDSITGSADLAPCHLAGSEPSVAPPGEAYRTARPCSVATLRRSGRGLKRDQGGFMQFTVRQVVLAMYSLKSAYNAGAVSPLRLTRGYSLLN